MEWVRQNKADFTAQSRAAVGARIAAHMAEKGSENISPMFVAAMQARQAEKKEDADSDLGGDDLYRGTIAASAVIPRAARSTAQPLTTRLRAALDER